MATQVEPYGFHELRKEFEQEMLAVTRDLLLQQRATLLPPENTSHYLHGSTWVQSTSTKDGDETHFVGHSHEVLLKLDDIVAHKLSIVPQNVASMVRGMHDGFQKMMYETVSKAADEVGNVVAAKDYGSPALAFLEMIRKIEFGVDRQGNPTRPQLHYGSTALKELMADAKARGKEFEVLVQSVIADKEKMAVENEQRRRRRFRGLR